MHNSDEKLVDEGLDKNFNKDSNNKFKNGLTKEFKFVPIFNISPNFYLPLIYILLILIILSLVIFNFVIFPKRSVKIVTSPVNSSVYINDEFIGISPVTVFSSTFPNRGRDLKIRVEKKNFEPYEGNLTFDNNVNYVKLKSLDTNNILINGYKESALWSLVDDVAPPILWESVSDYFDSLVDFEDINNTDNPLYKYLISSSAFITNKPQLSDFINAGVVAASDGKLPLYSSLGKSVKYINTLLEQTPDLPILIVNKILFDSKIEISSGEIDNLLAEHQRVVDRSVIDLSSTNRSVTVGELDFLFIPESSTITNNVNFIHPVKNPSFYVLKESLSIDNFKLFLDLNRDWSLDNLSSLIESGFVDSNYLNNFYTNLVSDESLSGELPVTNVSYYAAKAWCEWANDYYNSEIPEGYEIELISENMWYSAKEDVRIVDNGIWQWTNRGFYLYDHFLTSVGGKVLDEFTDVKPRLVVGSNKYNNMQESGRGVQSGEWCTPYVGFRPVLVEVEDNN